MVRNSQKTDLVFADVKDREEFHVICADISEKLSTPFPVDYIVHGANSTASKDFLTQPVEVIKSILYGTTNVLEFAKEKRIKSMVYLSSMEVYGITDPQKETVTEYDIGFIDTSAVRSCYPEGKRMAENLCTCYAKEYDVPVKIARLAQTFGAGVDYHDNRVFAQFTKAAIEKKNIVLHTQGNSKRNSCYTTDAIRGVLCMLNNGKNGETYNIANPQTSITIKDIAQLVAQKIADGKIDVEFDLDTQAGYSVDFQFNMNVEKMEKLGWKSYVELEEMYKRMSQSFLFYQTSKTLKNTACNNKVTS